MSATETLAESATGEKELSLLKRRRNPRVPVDFSVTLENLPDSLKRFSTSAKVVLISTGGATLIPAEKLTKGLLLVIKTPFGRDLKAEVNGVWTDRGDGKERAGIRLLEGTTWFDDQGTPF